MQRLVVNTMKKCVLSIVGIVLIVACLCGAAIAYVAKADADYPKDYTLEEYEANAEKNSDLIIDALEKINAPTLEETMKEYEKIGPTLDFYPTAFETIGIAGNLFVEKDYVPDFLMNYIGEWRQERFMYKNFPNAMHYQDEFEKEMYKYAETGELPPEKYQPRQYEHSDGGVVQISSGGMSVEYADGHAEAE